MKDEIKVTFPDKIFRRYPNGITGFEIADNISHVLAREIVAISYNNKVIGINEPLLEHGILRLHKAGDPEAKILIRNLRIKKLKRILK